MLLRVIKVNEQAVEMTVFKFLKNMVVVEIDSNMPITGNKTAAIII